MRRRLRRQRQMREALLLDLGALVFELNRHGRREPELLQAKAAELTAVDEEVRALAAALENEETIGQLVATGVAGSCENCGSLMSIDARYCASCGAPAVPALGDEKPREGIRAERPLDEHAALATAPADSEDFAPPEWAQAEPESASDEALAHEAEAEEEAWHEAAGEDVPVEEAAGEESAVEDAEDEAHDPEPAGEGVLSVTPMERDDEEAGEDAEDEAQTVEHPALDPEAPEAEEPEAEAELPEEPEPELEAEEPEPAAAASSADDGRAGQAPPHTPAGQAPRALADDALDTAAKAIRTGIARGREWIRGRRTSE